MKSTQDLCIWLNKVEQALGIDAENKVLCIEVFSDKSFRVSKHNGDSVDIIYDSDISPDKEDINELPYQSATEFAKLISQQ